MRNSKSSRAMCFLAASVGIPALTASAGTILVPQQYPTIQAGINAASDGDVVVVAAGTYTGAGNRDLNLMGKAITLRSASGPGTCIINAQATVNDQHSVFVISGGETRATVIDGFTITGGYSFNGAGVYVAHGDVTVQNCVITGNDCACWGGGVYVESASQPRFVNCRIVGNTSTDEGGGVFTVASGSPVFEGCVISNNSARIGGGICTFWGTTRFVDCIVASNTAEYYAGGAYLWGGEMSNCTVAGNSGNMWEYGSAAYLGGNAAISNSIIWGNGPGSQLYDGGTATVRYSIVEGGFVGVGNRADDPRFVDPLAGDFRVSRTSPAIDAGSNLLVFPGNTHDIAGRPRFYDEQLVVDSGQGPGPIVDMGAFESAPLFMPSRRQPSQR